MYQFQISAVSWLLSGVIVFKKKKKNNNGGKILLKTSVLHLCWIEADSPIMKLVKVSSLLTAVELHTMEFITQRLRLL